MKIYVYVMRLGLPLNCTKVGCLEDTPENSVTLYVDNLRLTLWMRYKSKTQPTSEPQSVKVQNQTEISVILEKSNDLNLSKGKVNTGEQTCPSTLANSTTTRLKDLAS